LVGLGATKENKTQLSHSNRNWVSTTIQVQPKTTTNYRQKLGKSVQSFTFVLNSCQMTEIKFFPFITDLENTKEVSVIRNLG